MLTFKLQSQHCLLSAGFYWPDTVALQGPDAVPATSFQTSSAIGVGSLTRCAGRP
jgi:hypothetical protein